MLTAGDGSGAGDFILKRPRDYDPGRTYPLLVALHGYGGDASGLARAFDALAGLPILIALPQGSYARPGGGFSWFLRTSERSLWTRADELAVERLVRCIADVKARESVDKIIVFGFSQGASLAYMAGLRNPSLVDGIAAVAGELPAIGEEGSILRMDHVAKARRIAIFVARGTADLAVARELFAAQKDFLDGQGFRVETMEFAGAHQLTSPLLARLWTWINRSVRSRG